MEWLDDSKACLDVAQTMLKELEEITQETIKNIDLVPYMKVKIKNCLENCRSPLDYAANYIFDTYCKTKYSEKELKRIKTQFPIITNKEGKDEKSEFDKCIKVKFKDLKENHPFIVDVFEKCQPFKSNPWLNNLTFLTNENKHRNLTKYNKNHSFDIRHLNAQIGNTFIQMKNVTGINIGTLIKNGDEEINLIDDASKKYINEIDADVSVTYYFSDLNIPVLPTLYEIYDGACSVILELENAFEGK